MYQFRSIAEYQADLLSGKISCKEVVNQFLENITSQNEELNAFLEVYSEEALFCATEIDKKIAQKSPLGRLFGVVIGVKDNIHVKNHRLTAASHILENYSAVYNATCIERILNEDAIIIGRQNCDEFAMGSSNENSAFGSVKNGFDTSRVPGGSSGGSAVAVQMKMCMVSLGTDTGGSVRQPADFCGVVGLKPSYGRVSRYGLVAYASSFDQLGILANNVEDVAFVLTVIAGDDNFDSTASDAFVPDYTLQLSSNQKYKFAYFPEALESEVLDPEIKHAIKESISDLKAKGHTVEPVHFGYLDYIVPTYYILTTAEASSNLSRFDGVKFGHRTALQGLSLDEFYKQSRTEGFGKEVKKRILLGTFVLSAGYFDAYYTKAQKVRRLLVDDTKNLFQSYDALLMPTVTAPAFKFGEKSNNPVEMYQSDIYTVYANLVGAAGISIPKYKHSNGMPFGLQILTDSMQEEKLLQIAQAIL